MNNENTIKANQSAKPYVAETPWLDPEAVPFIQIKGLSKQFDDFSAVDNVDLNIYKGELFTILGGSGCGKSTLLRMLAGFETPNAGQIIIDGIDMANIPAYDRPINMMFQSYAVFPHMTVEQNISYGLKKDNLAKAEIASRVKDMLELVQLSELAKRKPNQLSGGQRQRVALARALIKQPKVLLLDEPLAALDKKLREQTQFELMNLQYELGITFVVVTHDQEEAMTLSSRVAVMDAGKFVQIGTPSQVYESPSNRFVADFFGTINFFNATVLTADTETKTLCAALETTGTKLEATTDGTFNTGDEVTIAVRPEKISVTQKPPKGDHLTVTKGTVEDLAYYGNRSIYRVRSQSGRIIQVSAQNHQRSEQLALEWDDEVYLSWDSSCNVVLSK
ncbi:MAG: ABC transporter ATP-binding protein [Porticoccaceae bacterium]|nr:ABC transporter ATP-binding protein [Porticoccaceae bacterium]|tara:strand:- start:4044 stop:5219 length:1176 start_codon:yes stop_codon:yes gene_type:complete